MTTYLLDDAFSPLTWRIGFLNLPLDGAADALVSWRAEIGERPQCEGVREPLASALQHLEPLVAGARPRELLVECGSAWTAYFDCALQGGDPTSVVGYLSRRTGSLGLAVASVRGSQRGAPVFKPPARSFELFGAAGTHFLNYVRSVASVHNGNRWEFSASGTPQPFEDLRAYDAHRIEDRLTHEMLQRYCTAVVDIDVFDASSYAPRAVLVRKDVVIPAGAEIMSLSEAQARYGLTRSLVG